jgi:hypothetical protein
VADAVATAVLDVVAPLRAAAQSEVALVDLLDQLGWIPPQGETPAGALKGLGDIAAAADHLQAALAGPGASAETLLGLARAMGELLAALANAPTAGLPEPLDAPALWGRMAAELPAWLIAGYLRTRHPVAYLLALVTGVLDIEPAPPDANRANGQLVERLHWDRLGILLTDPRQLFAQVYGWGGPLDASRLLLPLREGLIACGVNCFAAEASQEQIDRHYGAGTETSDALLRLRIPLWSTDAAADAFAELGLELLPVPSAPGGAPAGLLIAPYASGALAASTALGDDLTLVFRGTVDGSGATGVIVLPGKIALLLDGPAVTSDLAVGLQFTPAAPVDLMGSKEGSHLSLRRATLEGAVAAGGPQVKEAVIRLSLAGVEVRVDLSEGDGFVASLARGAGIGASFDAGIAWSSTRGLVLEGGATEVPLAIDAGLGPVRIIGGRLRLNGSAGAAAEILLDATAALGPLALAVEGVGLRVSLSPGDRGVFFGADPHFALRPPDGLGASLDAGAVAGGGYLSHDASTGRYSGALCLRALHWSLDAFGLLDTRLPGGAPGYSFVALIAANLPPVQLGFGFTLDGVGGLVAIERTMSVPAIQAAVKSHAIEDVLFPANPAADAARIVATLGRLFPAAAGHFVFGPMARIGWGTPRLLDAELAILLELPNLRLAVLGELNASFPKPDDAIVELHVDVAGILDLSGKSLSFDASLRDSRIAGYSVAGDMALRLNWGERSAFALSVGGLHPHFPPPPGFPDLRRFTVALCTDNPRVTLQAYLALTSNSLQLGARAELYASYGVTLYGFVSFDALVTFSPFAFEVDLAGGVALRVGDTNIASVHLAGHLSGPSPWHIHGEAGISILFFDISVGFDVTFGDARKEVLPEADPWADLQKALAAASSYAPMLPPGERRVAAPKQQGTSAPLLFEPAGGLRFHQKVAPFDVQLTRYGSGVPKGGAQRFSLLGATAGGRALGLVRETDLFAPGQFTDLKDEEKLSGPSFVDWTAGFSAQPAAAMGAPSEAVEISFETWLIRGNADGTASEMLDAPAAIPTPAADAAAATSAAARKRRAQGGLDKYLADDELGLERMGGLLRKSLTLAEAP